MQIPMPALRQATLREIGGQKIAFTKADSIRRILGRVLKCYPLGVALLPRPKALITRSGSGFPRPSWNVS